MLFASNEMNEVIKSKYGHFIVIQMIKKCNK
jgi:hypothetical protein